MYSKEKKKLTGSIPKLLLILCAAMIGILSGNPKAGLLAAGKPVITLNVAKKNLVIGNSCKLKASIHNRSFKNHTVVWKSSKSSVATVSQKGNVKAIKAGTATITATVKGTSHKAACTVKVQKRTGASAGEKVHYANAGIEFDYPANLKINKVNGEDGSKTEFKDSDGNVAFWYEQGEKWRVDLGLDQAAYQKQLEETYQNVEIDKYARKTVNGNEVLNVIYRLTGKNNGKVTEYLLTSEFAFFDFRFSAAGEAFAEELIRSVRFSNT